MFRIVRKKALNSTVTRIMKGGNVAVIGGDAVTGAAAVISAMGAAKTAAKAIDEYLSKSKRRGQAYEAVPGSQWF